MTFKKILPLFGFFATRLCEGLVAEGLKGVVSVAVAEGLKGVVSVAVVLCKGLKMTGSDAPTPES